MENNGGNVSLSGLGDTEKISNPLNLTVNTHANIEKKHVV